MKETEIRNDEKPSKVPKQLQGKNWQKGKSGNPGGKRGTPPDIAHARELTRDQVERTVHILLQATPEASKAWIRRPGATNVEKLMGAILEKAVATQDVMRANFLLDRAGVILRKEPAKIVVEHLTDMSDEKLIELGRKALLVLGQQPLGSIDAEFTDMPSAGDHQ